MVHIAANLEIQKSTQIEIQLVATTLPLPGLEYTAVQLQMEAIEISAGKLEKLQQSPEPTDSMILKSTDDILATLRNQLLEGSINCHNFRLKARAAMRQFFAKPVRQMIGTCEYTS